MPCLCSTYVLLNRNFIFYGSFTPVTFIYYKRFCIILREISLVLACCNSTVLISTSWLLLKLVIGLFKIYSAVLSELIWITAKVRYFFHVFYMRHLLIGSQFFVCFLLIYFPSFDSACCISFLSTFKITCCIDSLNFS